MREILILGVLPEVIPGSITMPDPIAPIRQPCGGGWLRLASALGLRGSRR
jgi:hypothetical protein